MRSFRCGSHSEWSSLSWRPYRFASIDVLTMEGVEQDEESCHKWNRYLFDFYSRTRRPRVMRSSNRGTIKYAATPSPPPLFYVVPIVWRITYINNNAFNLRFLRVVWRNGCWRKLLFTSKKGITDYTQIVTLEKANIYRNTNVVDFEVHIAMVAKPMKLM